MTTQAGRISNYMNSGSDDAVNERFGVYDVNVNSYPSLLGEAGDSG